MKPFIETFTGRTFSPLKPDAKQIVIEDIAHALANQGRYTGHSRFRYSVAEHSVRVSELLEQHIPRHSGFMIPLWGLLHDAAEAYLVDLPSPLKLSPAFREPYARAEARLMRAVCRRFGLPTKEPTIVRWADATLLATEVRDLMHADRPYWTKLTHKAVGDRIRPWGADVAEYEFLRRFRLLGGS